MEQGNLRFDQLGDLGIVFACKQLRRELDAAMAVLFRDQPCLLRQRGIQPRLQDAVGGIGAGLVEADKHLPRLDRIAVAHQDLFDDPSLQMLDFLAAAIHLDQPRSDDRA